MEELMVKNPNAYLCFKADPNLIIEHFTRIVLDSKDPCDKSTLICVFPEAGACIAEARVAEGLLQQAPHMMKSLSRFVLMDKCFKWERRRLNEEEKEEALESTRNREGMIFFDSSLHREVKIVKYDDYDELCDAIERLVVDDEHVKIIIPGINVRNSCWSERDYTGLERYFTMCKDLHERGVLLHGFLNYIYYSCIDWSIMRQDAPEATVLEDRLDESGYIVIVWQSGWQERWDAIKDRCQRAIRKMSSQN